MKKRRNSNLSKFFKGNFLNRLEEIVQWLDKSKPDELLKEGLSVKLAENMIENVIGVFNMPLAVATNFTINGIDTLVPMAIEEPSVVAAASNAAKIARAGGGFFCEASSSTMIAQIELLNSKKNASQKIINAQDEIIKLANSTQLELVKLGGGATRLDVRTSVGEKRIVVHLHVNCIDAMGANMVNTMAEAVAPKIKILSEGQVGLRILSNLADSRIAKASCLIPFDALDRKGFKGKDVAAAIVAASNFALADPYRAATHNKGIFNGIDAVLLATGNDWRAVEAGGHAFAALSGQYKPLAVWNISNAKLNGKIALPMAVGIIGGTSKAHPTAKTCLEILGAESAKDLAQVVAATGLASNLAALAALSCEGIQHGHMKLHKRKKNTHITINN